MRLLRKDCFHHSVLDLAPDMEDSMLNHALHKYMDTPHSHNKHSIHHIHTPLQAGTLQLDILPLEGVSRPPTLVDIRQPVVIHQV